VREEDKIRGLLGAKIIPALVGVLFNGDKDTAFEKREMKVLGAYNDDGEQFCGVAEVVETATQGRPSFREL
jgi:hypothetical protein